jgi:1,2-diacylglycerol 3-alpha-glucosyltransferase
VRILMASHAYPPIISGVSLVVQKLARAMVQRGHSVTVVTGELRKGRGSEEDEGVRLVRIGGVTNPWWRETVIPLIGLRRFMGLAADCGAEILHSHEFFVMGRQLTRLARKAGLPALATCQHVPRFVTRYTWTNKLHGIVEPVVRISSVRILNQFDHVVFSTETHQAAYLQWGLKVPSSLITNGVDTTWYRPLAERVGDIESRLELPSGPRILFVSRLARDKEIDVLIGAMPQVWAAHRAHLLLVGRGDDRARLEALVDEQNLRHCVHFLGFVPEEDMPSLYNAADLFAIASTCEVQSLPTLQALATGLPVVAADAMALPELVRDGVSGYLVPPGDLEAMARAICSILDDPGRASQMGAEGLTIVRNHAETRTFDRYEELYGQMLSSR